MPELKMSKGGMAVPSSMAGEMRYTNQLLIRKVTTSLNEQVSLTPISRMLDDGGRIEVNSQSIVVDPVEFIRTVDLMRYYGSKFQGGETERIRQPQEKFYKSSEVRDRHDEAWESAV